MHTNTIRTLPLNSTFLSCEKDTETILRKLFVENQPYSDELKRLLVINTPDCISDRTNEAYKEIVASMDLKDLIDKQYIKLDPKVKAYEGEEIKSYIMFRYSSFYPTSNTEFRDGNIIFNIICHTDYWKMDNYQIRPLKIAGYIDGILNNARLSGIGELKFSSLSEFVLSDELGGYTLIYTATHGHDDALPPEED